MPDDEQTPGIIVETRWNPTVVMVAVVVLTWLIGPRLTKPPPLACPFEQRETAVTTFDLELEPPKAARYGKPTVRLTVPCRDLGPIAQFQRQGRMDGVDSRLRLSNGEPELFGLFVHSRRPLPIAGPRLLDLYAASQPPVLTDVLDANGRSIGLQKVVHIRPGWEQQGLLVAQEGGVVTDLLICDKPDAVPVPHCKQYVDAKTVEMEAFYPIRHLERWRDYKGFVRSYVDSITEEAAR